MVDIKSGQQRVAVKYLQSESDMMARLEDLRTLRATFAPCPSLPQPSDAPGVRATQLTASRQQASCIHDTVTQQCNA